MSKTYIITGAMGHLGNTLIRMISGNGDRIFGLIQRDRKQQELPNVRYFKGDVRDIDSMRPIFEAASGGEFYVIHTAGIIDISKDVSPLIKDVNINGTKNIISLCREYGAKRLLYVSSVHAIPEKENYGVITEQDSFSPDDVVGAYACTKAEATQAVLDAGRAGLDIVVVHPSGIIGPYDRSNNHLVQMISEYIKGSLPACVKGGYDFVDVRDVAKGCLLALQKGKPGSCYILSNRHYEIKEILNMVRSEKAGHRIVVLPMWMAEMFSPLMQGIAKLKKVRPLYTRYSLYALKSNDRFSHDKATKELGYSPRDMRETIRDTVKWYRSLHPQKIRTKKRRGRAALSRELCS
ncbi:MAG: NAD-dependent epimerase/dehydratase family protein [Candidatus Limivicinus sp.]|jgi:dihydroflavonol-4-reductase